MIRWFIQMEKLLLPVMKLFPDLPFIIKHFVSFKPIYGLDFLLNLLMDQIVGWSSFFNFLCLSVDRIIPFFDQFFIILSPFFPHFFVDVSLLFNLFSSLFLNLKSDCHSLLIELFYIFYQLSSLFLLLDLL